MSLHDPLFTTYVIAASLMILKAVTMAWLTVIRMMEVKGGYRSPEDLKRTPLNPAPDPAQLLPNERVERIRRIQMNDLESLPYFLIAGLLYVVVTQPSRGTRGPVECGLAHPDLHDRPHVARRARCLTVTRQGRPCVGPPDIARGPRPA
jgi:hypothetical protein